MKISDIAHIMIINSTVPLLIIPLLKSINYKITDKAVDASIAITAAVTVAGRESKYADM